MVKSKSCAGVQNAFLMRSPHKMGRSVRAGRGKERFQPGQLISDCFIFPTFGGKENFNRKLQTNFPFTCLF